MRSLKLKVTYYLPYLFIQDFKYAQLYQTTSLPNNHAMSTPDTNSYELKPRCYWVDFKTLTNQNAQTSINQSQFAELLQKIVQIVWGLNLTLSYILYKYIDIIEVEIQREGKPKLLVIFFFVNAKQSLIGYFLNLDYYRV